jgi:hypothetical protein
MNPVTHQTKETSTNTVCLSVTKLASFENTKYDNLETKVSFGSGVSRVDPAISIHVAATVANHTPAQLTGPGPTEIISTATVVKLQKISVLIAHPVYGAAAFHAGQLSSAAPANHEGDCVATV